MRSSWSLAWKKPLGSGSRTRKSRARRYGRLVRFTIIFSKNAEKLFKLAERSTIPREFTPSRKQRQLGRTGISHLFGNQLAQRERSPRLADLRPDKRSAHESARTRDAGGPDVFETSHQSVRLIPHLAVLPAQPRRSDQKLQLERPLALPAVVSLRLAGYARALHHRSAREKEARIHLPAWLRQNRRRRASD